MVKTYLSYPAFFLAVILTAVLTACGPKGNPLESRISELEDELYQESGFTMDKEGLDKAGELMSAYLEYADQLKDSTDAPFYLFKAADLAMSINRINESLEIYNRIIFQYPDFEKAPECLFLMGFIYENYLQNYGKAKEIYEQFLVKYPGNEFADDAASSIQNLGKSPEELIREFEEKNEGSPVE